MSGCMPHILLASPLTELNVHVRAHQNIRPVHQHNFHNTFFSSFTAITARVCHGSCFGKRAIFWWCELSRDITDLTWVFWRAVTCGGTRRVVTALPRRSAPRAPCSSQTPPDRTLTPSRAHLLLLATTDILWTWPQASVDYMYA